MSASVVLLAAGRGTRYGGLKQLEGLGPNGELLLDYAIADAVEAGFDHIVLVIRRENLHLFEAKLALHALRSRFELEFVFQEESNGTGEAAYAARDAVSEPFILLNCDDYYGSSAIYKKAFSFLQELDPAEAVPQYGLLGFPLFETLSPVGQVARGICQVDAEQHLVHIEELFEIHLGPDGAIFGKNASGVQRQLDERSVCSMSFWMLSPRFFPALASDYAAYLSRPHPSGRTGEFHLPAAIEAQREAGQAVFTVIPVEHSEWCGVTSPEDREIVMLKLAALHATGRYGRLRIPES